MRILLLGVCAGLMAGCGRNETLNYSRYQNPAPRVELLNQSTNSPDLFTVVVDEKSGQYAAVSGDGHAIALKDKSGNLIWRNDLIAKYRTNLPMYSTGKIGSLKFAEGQIVIRIGIDWICIEPQSGKIIRVASR